MPHRQRPEQKWEALALSSSRGGQEEEEGRRARGLIDIVALQADTFQRETIEGWGARLWVGIAAWSVRVPDVVKAIIVAEREDQHARWVGGDGGASSGQQHK
jgi:hypothetical protein